MSEDRLNKLETAMTSMAEKFSEFLAVESARQERDKHQLEINERFTEFIDEYKDKDRSVISAARKQQAWISFFVGKIVLPAIIGAILIGAGAVIYEKASPSSIAAIKDSAKGSK